MNRIKIICQAARGACYNEENKAGYKRLALNFLRLVAKRMGLPKDSYYIRFSPGGIAVAGDAILHHNKFYLSFNETGCMFRPCAGQKDYRGGRNEWAWGFNLGMTEDQLISTLSVYRDQN